MLDHEWLKMPSNYDTKYSEIELQLKQQKKEEEAIKKEQDKKLGVVNFEEDELRIETSKLVPSDIEQHNGDDELSTLSDTHFLDYEDDDYWFESDEEIGGANSPT